MKRYAVYIEQVNQERIIVNAENQADARHKALEIWREDYALCAIIDVMELPKEEWK